MKKTKAQYKKAYQSQRKSIMKYRYGISIDIYNRLCELQKNMCAICGKKRMLCVDHNHTTNEVRGLLCHQCNTGIGFFEENADWLIEAAAYLEKNIG